MTRVREAELGSGDDAAVPRPPREALLVQTADFFRAFVSDPRLFGRIAANHALDDVCAMGAKPRTALAIAPLPPAGDTILGEDLCQMPKGGLEAVGVRPVGGHGAACPIGEPADPKLLAGSS
ncbi:AIR synthase related protein [Benzoatithermus flavus]